MKPDNSLIKKTGADHIYFTHLNEGRFLLPWCDACAKFHFFPRALCPQCGSDSLTWDAPSGKGTVYASTVVRRADGDYNVCLVDLDEGPRMMSQVVDIPAQDVRIGLRVSAKILRQETGVLLVFGPEESAQ